MIYGLTDRIGLRRDGKIRAGTRDESGKMHNPPHFLLHDAPQLIPVIGETPTEFYFTVHTDDAREFFRDDLRWYTKSELMCVGDGRLAAYTGFTDVPGLKQTAHPEFKKARARNCLYTSCPEYLEGKCGEHFFLDMIVPQYSLGSVFTLDNTSKLAILNIGSSISKAVLASSGKLSGQIFRLYKKVVAVPFTDMEKAKKYNRDQAVIHMDFVPFEVYEKNFRDKISPDNWAALMGLRNRDPRFVASLPVAAEAVAVGMDARVALPSPDEKAADDAALAGRANDPTVIKLLDQLSALTGTPNTEENRIKTARNFPNLGEMVSYLQKKVKERSKVAEAPAAAPLPPPAANGAVRGNLF